MMDMLTKFYRKRKNVMRGLQQCSFECFFFLKTFPSFPISLIIMQFNALSYPVHVAILHHF